MAYMAVSGEDLCISAKDGFLMYKKYDNVYEEHRRVARQLVLLTKFGITILNCGILLCMIKDLKIDVTSPLVIIFMLTIYTVNMFLNTLDMGIMGIMTAYTIDISINTEARKAP
jgi:hypothetical protein